ncbi:quinone oxidoreductase-like protein 2 isoform X4 [Ochotona princeps]|uniref:quinone oxidoreductase-like protein 2 isoform X4 n=1 Tax=Ochotona princeps TaxID=9978 RepID=UPI002715376A|nr:quinone oxidoreductase-like protein 2 isoform X4 [Ochotona princeps]
MAKQVQLPLCPERPKAACPAPGRTTRVTPAPVSRCRTAGQAVGRHYRAAVCAELNQPLAIKEVAPRPVRPHEVRVDVHFCGVNFVDLLVCRGQYQEKPPVPFTPGLEFSGTVLETGPDVSSVKEGDRVIGMINFNAMAEECITDQKVIAAAGSDEKCKLAMQRGAQFSVNYTEGSLREAVKKLVGDRRVHAAIDMVGGEVFLQALRSLAWEGRIVVLGFAGGNIASLPTNLLLLKNVSAMGMTLDLYRDRNIPLLYERLSSALQYCQQGCLHPHVGRVFKLEEVNDAFVHVLQRKSTGKVLLSLK